MATVEVVVSGSVGGWQSTPLTITPTTAQLNPQTGVPFPETVLATVSGGVPPYTYALDPAITNPGTVPNGMTVDENAGVGIIGISGTPTDPAGTAINFGVIATDSAGATAQFKVKKVVG